jgi:hypothetical protein
MFYDAIHLGAAGRKLMSDSLAPYMNTSADVSDLPRESGICKLQRSSTETSADPST